MAGLGSSVWVQRRVRYTADKYAPQHVRQAVADRSRDVGDRARQAVIDLREAVAEGRGAMRDTSAQLKAEFSGAEPSHAGTARSLPGKRPGSAASRPRAD